MRCWRDSVFAASEGLPNIVTVNVLTHRDTTLPEGITAMRFVRDEEKDSNFMTVRFRHYAAFVERVRQKEGKSAIFYTDLDIVFAKNFTDILRESYDVAFSGRPRCYGPGDCRISVQLGVFVVKVEPERSQPDDFLALAQQEILKLPPIWAVDQVGINNIFRHIFTQEQVALFARTGSAETTGFGGCVVKAVSTSLYGASFEYKGRQQDASRDFRVLHYKGGRKSTMCRDATLLQRKGRSALWNQYHSQGHRKRYSHVKRERKKSTFQMGSFLMTSSSSSKKKSKKAGGRDRSSSSSRKKAENRDRSSSPPRNKAENWDRPSSSARGNAKERSREIAKKPFKRKKSKKA